MAQHIAAFSQFGLVDVEGEKENRKVKISDLAFKIIMDERPVSPERDGFVRKAALLPSMFLKIYNRYPNGLPEDAAIEYELKVQHGFNPNSVHDFIDTFRSTMEFAKIYKYDILAETTDNTKEQKMNSGHNISVSDNVSVSDTPKPPPIIHGEKINFPVKISEKMSVNLEIQFPIEDDDLRRFLSTINALKPGILQSVLDGKDEADKEED